jgi:hypothetical protein
MITELFRDMEIHSSDKKHPSIFKARYEEEHIETFFEAIAFIGEDSDDEDIATPSFVRLPRSIQQFRQKFEKLNNYKIRDYPERHTKNQRTAFHRDIL